MNEIENPMVRERSTLTATERRILSDIIAETYYKQKKPLTENQGGNNCFYNPSVPHKGGNVNA